MKRLACALMLMPLLAGCSSHRTILDPPLTAAAPSSSRSQPRPPRPDREDSTRPAEGLPQAGPVQLAALKGEAESWIGTPYQWGGNTRRGIDCSGFVHNVYQILGLELPRTVETLYELGESVKRRKMKTGDLVFFRFKGRAGPTHVGIYLGQGVFIHSSVGRGVRLDTIEGGAYEENFYGSRRILA